MKYTVVFAAGQLLYFQIWFCNWRNIE